MAVFSISKISNLSTPAIILNGWPVSTLQVNLILYLDWTPTLLMERLFRIMVEVERFESSIVQVKVVYITTSLYYNIWYSRSDSNRDRALIWSLMPGINRLHYRCATGA